MVFHTDFGKSAGSKQKVPVPAPGTRSDALNKFLEKMSMMFCLQDSLKAGFSETCIQKVTLKLT